MAPAAAVLTARVAASAAVEVDSAAAAAASVWWRKLKLKAKCESASSLISFKRLVQQRVQLYWTLIPKHLILNPKT
jgi:hypothetical protein